MIVAALSAAPPPSAEASPRDSRAGFFGVVTQGPVPPTGADLARMGRGGVGELRYPLAWPAVQPSPAEFEWSRLDRLVGAAARHRVRILPSIAGTPSWLGEEPASPPTRNPRQRAAWRAFLRALAGRYGPGGSFWENRERILPIREWQIWNEPNFTRFFKPRPSARRYAVLVRGSAHALRQVDPGARIVLGGIAPVHRGPLPQVFLRRFYRVPGIERHFDALALHPYAPRLSNVREQVIKIRRVAARAGDGRVPLEITEIGWASNGPPGFGLIKSERGQARILGRALGMLFDRRRAWRIGGVHWFAWRDAESPEARCSFCQFAGLHTATGKPKPAWDVFRRLARARRP